MTESAVRALCVAIQARLEEVEACRLYALESLDFRMVAPHLSASSSLISPRYEELRDSIERTAAIKKIALEEEWVVADLVLAHIHAGTNSEEDRLVVLKWGALPYAPVEPSTLVFIPSADDRIIGTISAPRGIKACDIVIRRPATTWAWVGTRYSYSVAFADSAIFSSPSEMRAAAESVASRLQVIVNLVQLVPGSDISHHHSLLLFLEVDLSIGGVRVCVDVPLPPGPGSWALHASRVALGGVELDLGALTEHVRVVGMHIHSAACNHATAPAGAVFAAAESGDVRALVVALGKGGSTDEVDKVRSMRGRHGLY